MWLPDETFRIAIIRNARESAGGLFFMPMPVVDIRHVVMLMLFCGMLMLVRMYASYC